MNKLTLCMIDYGSLYSTIDHLEKFGWKRIGKPKDIRNEVYPQGNTKDNQLLTITMVRENTND